MKGYNILIVEDDSMIASSLKRLLESRGARVETNSTGENVIEQLHDIHLILMDIMLPFDNGIAITQAVREHYHIPIIFLSARNDIESKLDGLQNGEDYLTKPFHPLELIARIEKVLSNTYTEEIEKYYDFHIDKKHKQLMDNDHIEIELSKTERKLFFYLYENTNVVLEKDKIMQFMWPNGDAFDNSLNVYIKKLRTKLNDVDNSMINTVYGIGYRMNSYEK